jgi:hypothetical protein
MSKNQEFKMHIYLLRKHPRYPYNNWGERTHLEAFTVEGVYSEHATPARIAKEKNKRSNFLWTVSRKIVSGGTK